VNITSTSPRLWLQNQTSSSRGVVVSSGARVVSSRPMGKGLFVVLGALSAAASPGVALAQEAQAGEAEAAGEVDAADAEARSLFDAGSMAFSHGRYEEALERFERAYDLSGRPELLYNIAATHDRLRNDEAALEHFERFIADVPDTERSSEVEARIAVLRAQIERASAPTPEDTARVAPPEAAPEPTAAEEDDGSTWWIWAGAGVLVIGAAVVAVVLLSGGGTQDPIEGNVGVVWETLRGPR
jgi:hypothetical protein